MGPGGKAWGVVPSGPSGGGGAGGEEALQDFRGSTATQQPRQPRGVTVAPLPLSSLHSRWKKMGKAAGWGESQHCPSSHRISEARALSLLARRRCRCET